MHFMSFEQEADDAALLKYSFSLSRKQPGGLPLLETSSTVS
jgi:hypothetical protein